MREKLTVLAVIPARGGSKSIPRKNLAFLGKKPLIQWSIERAKQSTYIDTVMVSTDDIEIAQISEQFNVKVHKRSKENSTDSALVGEAIKELLLSLKELPTYLVLLEPTAPFRRVSDIEGCIKEMKDRDLDSIATYSPAALNPHRAWKINDGNPMPFISEADPWLPRQKLPEAYQLNGAVYVIKVSEFLNQGGKSFVFGKTGAHIMPVEYSIDIDNKIDLVIANALLDQMEEDYL